MQLALFLLLATSIFVLGKGDPCEPNPCLSNTVCHSFENEHFCRNKALEGRKKRSIEEREKRSKSKSKSSSKGSGSGSSEEDPCNPDNPCGGGGVCETCACDGSGSSEETESCVCSDMLMSTTEMSVRKGSKSKSKSKEKSSKSSSKSKSSKSSSSKSKSASGSGEDLGYMCTCPMGFFGYDCGTIAGINVVRVGYTLVPSGGLVLLISIPGTTIDDCKTSCEGNSFCNFVARNIQTDMCYLYRIVTGAFTLQWIVNAQFESFLYDLPSDEATPGGDCDPDPCVYGQCVEGSLVRGTLPDPDYQCVCKTGFTGDACDEIDTALLPTAAILRGQVLVKARNRGFRYLTKVSCASMRGCWLKCLRRRTCNYFERKKSSVNGIFWGFLYQIVYRIAVLELTAARGPTGFDSYILELRVAVPPPPPPPPPVRAGCVLVKVGLTPRNQVVRFGHGHLMQILTTIIRSCRDKGIEIIYRLCASCPDITVRYGPPITSRFDLFLQCIDGNLKGNWINGPRTVHNYIRMIKCI